MGYNGLEREVFMMTKRVTKKTSQSILEELNLKFTQNISLSVEQEINNLTRVELKARKIAILGQIINEFTDLTITQKEIIPIFDEIFSDTITSIYLASCSLDKPAQIVLRRVLELGIALIYLWDLPSMFWEWKCHDGDLNYNDMIAYLTSNGYKTYIENLNLSFKGEAVFNSSSARKLYRCLSNTTHGKISTFESNLPSRFLHNIDDWKSHIELVENVVDLLFELWNKRFYNFIPEMERRTPSSKKTSKKIEGD